MRLNTNKVDPFSPSMLLNPLAVQVPVPMAGGYSCLGALLSVLYASIHWTLAASVFYSVVMLGLSRDRRGGMTRQQAMTINQLAALAWEKIESGAEAAAVRELMALYQHTPDHHLVQFYLSRALIGVDPARGRDLMLAYIHSMHEKAQPCDMDAYVTLGQHCCDIGNFAEAEWVWREGQRLSTNDSCRIYFVLSRALLYAENNPQHALDILDEAPRKSSFDSPLHCDLHYWRGRCYEAMEQKEAAKKEYETLCAINAGHEDVATRLRKLQLAW